MLKFNSNKLVIILLAPLILLAILLAKSHVLPSNLYIPLIALFSFALGGFIVFSFLKIKIDRLRQLTNTDHTTGLYSAKAINKLLNYDIERAKRYKRDLSIILLDIDNFALIIETYGKKRAEEVLKFLSTIILDGIEYVDKEKKEFHGIRSSDIAFRYEGDNKILVVMPETSAKGAFIAAERIREAVMFTPFGDRGQDSNEYLRITLSAGVVSFDKEQDTAETLLQRVNLLLLKAKITTNEVVIENPIHNGLVVFGNANSSF